MNLKGGVFFKSNDINKVADDLSSFQKVVLFTWVSIFILLNSRQWQIDLKISGDIESNPVPTHIVNKAI